MSKLKRVSALFLILGVISVPQLASAQEKSAFKPGFSLPASARIILLRPDIKVGEQSTGGMFEPNMDWTEQARGLIEAELRRVQADVGNEITAYPEPVGRDAVVLADYRALFAAVASAVQEFKLFPGNRLPSKKNEQLDYTLGSGVSALTAAGPADFALFILTEDQYGSTGRKIFQFMAAGLLGAGVQSGVHKGYAGLVDLRTGDLVWINADYAMGGDVRTAEGATKRVRQLLEDFPGLSAKSASLAATQP